MHAITRTVKFGSITQGEHNSSCKRHDDKSEKSIRNFIEKRIVYFWSISVFVRPCSRLKAAIPIIMYIHYGVAVTSKELGCEKVKAEK